MVVIHVKRGDESLFLYESQLSCLVETITETLVQIHNGCLKVKRICSEIELLRDYGVLKCNEQLPNERNEALAATNENEGIYEPKGGFEENRDPSGARIGKRPKEEMREILSKVVAEARGIISKEQVKSGNFLTLQHISDALLILRGGLDIVYPSGIPEIDPVRQELENRESLSGTPEEKKLLHPVMTQIWFANKVLETGKKLSDYFGKNEKTKVVVKLQPKGAGIPPREPLLTEDQKKALMMAEFRRREDLKKLEEDEDNSYLNSDWADNLHLKKTFHGLDNVKWKPH